MSKLQLTIATPSSTVYEDAVDQITLTTTSGEITILPKHVPLISQLETGHVMVKKEGKDIDLEKYRNNARKVLNTFISLGPVYIKLGQWLSSRADILPQPYLEELAKLQDNVPAAPFNQVKPIIENDIFLECNILNEFLLCS